MGTVRIQTVCGFGCGSSLFLKMKIEEILKENKLSRPSPFPSMIL